MVDGATTDATIGGRIYALPDSVRPQVLFLQQDIFFDKYGVDAEQMNTMEGYIEPRTPVKGKKQREVLSFLHRYKQTWRYWGRRSLSPSLALKSG